MQVLRDWVIRKLGGVPRADVEHERAKYEVRVKSLHESLGQVHSLKAELSELREYTQEVVRRDLWALNAGWLARGRLDTYTDAQTMGKVHVLRLPEIRLSACVTLSLMCSSTPYLKDLVCDVWAREFRNQLPKILDNMQ